MVPETAVLFYRDHELARIADANADVPVAFRQLVETRRKEDSSFPREVSGLELGLPRPRVSTIPPGEPDKFANVAQDRLLATLAKAVNERWIGDADHATAFARTVEGKTRILAALEKGTFDSDAEVALELLFSYPSDELDIAALSQIAPRIAKFIGNLPILIVTKFAGRLTAWLDAADERVANFDGAVRLWHVLLPVAVIDANRRKGEEDEASSDLSSAALNEPLGHLISFFLRRCPSMPPQGEGPSLPAEFVVPLKQLSGRAREIMANRMALSMNYFALADRPWLESFVLAPMLSESKESLRLWEALGKFGRVPTPDLWATLELEFYRRLSSAGLSPEARRQLAEMCVIVWVRSKQSGTLYGVKSASLRSALGLASEDVRADVAWPLLDHF
jgi:hypothetical protein